MTTPISLESLLAHRRVLLLQGPMGPFFRRLAVFLEQHAGQEVWKVNFNGGDALFFHGRRTLNYRGRLSDWAPWLRELLQQLDFDALVLFGQARARHELSIAAAAELGIAVYVFEEGYLRPDYVTLERDGVNRHSSLPRDPAYYRRQSLLPSLAPVPTRQRFAVMALHAMAYVVAKTVLHPLYPHAVYHRPLNPLVESARWLRGGWRKLWHRWAQRDDLRKLTSLACSGRWFLLPLQVHNDSQIRRDSPFDSIEEVITHVMTSFADHAPADTTLVIKHHPMDRAYRHYGRFIAQEVRRHGLVGRVRYVHDLHLPTLLKHTRGVVTVNSTAGMQALHHRRPVCTLTECLYSLPGLVHTGTLDSFWRSPVEPDRPLFLRFRQQLLAQTQLNASFYGPAPGLEPRRVTLALQRRQAVAAALGRPATPLPAEPETTLEQRESVAAAAPVAVPQPSQTTPTQYDYSTHGACTL